MRHRRHCRSTQWHSKWSASNSWTHLCRYCTCSYTSRHWQGNFHQISKTGRFSLSKLGVDKADMKSVEQRTSYVPHTYGNKIVYFYDRMQGIGLKGGTQEQEEWCIIIKTLLATTNQLCIHQKCTQRINASGYGRQQFKSHYQIWTQQGMVGSIFCSHEQCHPVDCQHNSRCRTAAPS